MKKLKLLLAAGVALAGYVVGKKGLKEQLQKSKSANDALSTLGASLRKDGTKLVHDAQELLKSDKIQKTIKQAKATATKQYNNVKKQVTNSVKGTKTVASKASGVKKTVAKKGAASKKVAKKIVKKSTKKA